MEFSSAFRNLRNGRAIKRPKWMGFIYREQVTPAENPPPQYDNTATYAQNDKVTYQGRYYKCKANGTSGHLPTETGYWDAYTLTPEEYKIVFHNRSGTEYEFYYNSQSSSATNLPLDHELLDHIVENDWVEGSKADYADAADEESEQHW